MLEKEVRSCLTAFNIPSDTIHISFITVVVESKDKDYYIEKAYQMRVIVAPSEETKSQLQAFKNVITGNYEFIIEEKGCFRSVDNNEEIAYLK